MIGRRTILGGLFAAPLAPLTHKQEGGHPVAFKRAVARLSELVADSITGATITGGEIIGAIITGSLFRTAASGKRVEISDDTGSGWIRFWGAITSLNPTILQPGRVISDGDLTLGIASPDKFGNNATATVLLNCENASGAGNALAAVNAQGAIELNATQGIKVQGAAGLVAVSPLHGIFFDDLTGLTTDANGDVTISHHLGAAPLYCSLVSRVTAFTQARVTNRTATQVTFRCFTAAGVAAASTAISCQVLFLL